MHARELKDVQYGPHERNVLDAYLLGKSEKPSPAVIFFHGGGYVGGDKSSIQTTRLMEECMEAGISVISANYRFISKDPYPAPMEDGARAIQFVRHMAGEWHIDPARIATAGSSAGGHIALWNALRGDLSKPDSADPVERENTEVSAFIGFGTQVSKDQRFYRDIYAGPHIQPNLKLYYGLESLDELYEPHNLRLAEEASAITYMSDKAPPVLMHYDFVLDEPRIPADAPVSEVIHHPMHGYVLKQRYDELGKTFLLRHKGDPLLAGEMTKLLLDSFGSR
ncbi:alpha/beta hydrolase [Paenibacillus hodogayensis]|uniref:Alpha/beta hydrolase n=1 Tax=Paenibacillus hodogayensis TaxID=279208 RepID=A0ABV5VRA3_9BACL